MHGVVVHARRGERAAYRPLESPLCPGSSDPLAVVEALLRLHPFPALYVADLDAITGGAAQHGVLRSLRRRFPALALWVDAGFRTRAQLARFRDRGPGRAVLGSETLALPFPPAATGAAILSLDWRGGGFLGPRPLDRAPALWPPEVILMTLGRVGAGRGPDLDRLRRYRRLSPATRFYAAGGVRGPADLRRLAAAGAAGALVASALHDGRIGPATLRRFARAPLS